MLKRERGVRQMVEAITATYVQEDAIRRVTLDGVQRSRSAPSLSDDLISACGQEHPDGGAERRLVVDDYDARTIAVECQGRLKTHPFAPVENAPPFS